MLKLIYTPTSEITDRDLVPGSKWRRVRDEDGPLKEPYECVLIRSASAAQIQWCLSHNGDLLWTEGNDPWQIVHAGSMLTWLRRDFKRAGEGAVGEMKSIELVPVGNMFIYDKKRYIKGCDGTCSERWLICWGFDHSGARHFSDSAVVRDLGPIEIDDTVKGVG